MTSPRIQIAGGVVEGLHMDDGVQAFLGIPFAAPPVKELRWRPPQPPTPWNNVRLAKSYGKSALQFPVPQNSIYNGGETDFGEDCLYLNVWTNVGQENANQESRPVMVVLHFGAFQFGSSSNPVFKGHAMASQGVILVSCNYRLGRLGFLSHPDLDSESNSKYSGNYGHMDQIAALQWVQHNIAAFGGDPGNVTLMGVSAGANSVINLRTSPFAKDLFHKCIVCSGPGMAPALDGYGHPAHPSTLAAGHQAGSEVMELLGVKSMEHLRSIPAEQIAGVQLPRTAGNWSFDLIPVGGISLHVFDSAYPVIDGHVLPTVPVNAYLKGEGLIDIPMLASNTGNEAAGLPYLATLESYHAYVSETFGDFAKEVLELYPAINDAEAKESSWQLAGDHIFVWSTWTAARLQSQNLKSKIWYARFLHQPPIPQTSGLIEAGYAGAFHGADVAYGLGNLNSRSWDWTPDDMKLSKDMLRAWVNFARHGDPNDVGSALWPPMTKALPAVKIWDTHQRLDAEGPSPERMAFWDRFHGIRNKFS